MEFLPPIEILRRVSNWSLHSIVEDEIQHKQNLIFIHSKLEISRTKLQIKIHSTKRSPSIA